MAKAVHWQIPFRSRLGTLYRIDIYDEGYTGSPVALTGAQDAFTTDEDTSEDFFTAVRAQSGNIRIINQGVQLLEQLHPQSTLDRPVRLVNASNGNAVEWQGFLSTEAYDQEYVGFTTYLSLPVISSLRAMQSIEVAVNDDMQFTTVLTHYIAAFYTLANQIGVGNWFGTFYLPNRYFEAMRDLSLYQNFCLEVEDVFNQGNITVEAHSVSCSEVVEYIAEFFGCVVREDGTNIYMTDVQNYSGARAYQYTTYANLVAALIVGVGTLSTTALTVSVNQPMETLVWVDENHRKSIMMGARRVKVEANLKEFDCAMELPPMPYNSLVQGTRIATIYANTNDQSYNLTSYKYIHARITLPEDPYYPSDPTTDQAVLTKVSMLTTLPYDQTAAWAQNNWSRFYLEFYNGLEDEVISDLYLCAFLSQWVDGDGEDNTGLMICGFPIRLYSTANVTNGRPENKSGLPLVESEALYTQKTILPFGARSGWFNINAKILMARGALNYYPDKPLMDPQSSHPNYMRPGLTMSFKFGNKYWTGNNWSSSFTTFFMEFDTDGTVKSNKNALWDTNEENGYFMSVPYPYQAGTVELKIYHEVGGIISQGTYFDQVTDIFLSQLDVKYIAPDSLMLSDDSANIYTKNTGAPFSEIETKNVHIATDLYNDVRSNMLYHNRGNIPTVKLFSLDGVQVRFEEDLLDRMVAYYAATRRKLSLGVQHPTSVPLPQMQLDGIGDGKKYLPLAESREWADDKSTLTCFETVND